MLATLVVNPGPHGADGDPVIGTIGGILLLVVLVSVGVWTATTWWRRRR